MRIYRNNIFMCLAILCAFMFLSPNAFAAKAGFEDVGTLSPPYGATGDPGGTKLTGVMYIFYEDYHTSPPPPDGDGKKYYAAARFSLRLQREKSGFPFTYYDDYRIPGTYDLIDVADPNSIIALFYSFLELKVEADFFEGENMCIKIKSMKNQGVFNYFPNGPETSPEHIVVIVDVELAAKPYVEGECNY